MVPTIHGHLYKTHAGLAKFASEQTSAAVFVAFLAADAVEIERSLTLFREIYQLRRRGLHAESEFHVLDHPFHVGITVQFFEQTLVQSLG